MLASHEGRNACHQATRVMLAVFGFVEPEGPPYLSSVVRCLSASDVSRDAEAVVLGPLAATSDHSRELKAIEALALRGHRLIIRGPYSRRFAAFMITLAAKGFVFDTSLPELETWEICCKRMTDRGTRMVVPSLLLKALIPTVTARGLLVALSVLATRHGGTIADQARAGGMASRTLHSRYRDVSLPNPKHVRDWILLLYDGYLRELNGYSRKQTATLLGVSEACVRAARRRTGGGTMPPAGVVALAEQAKGSFGMRGVNDPTFLRTASIPEPE